MKKQRIASTLKTGLIALTPIFILGLLFSWLWNFLISWGFFGNIFLNFFVNLVIISSFIYLMGWFLERSWLRWLRQVIRWVLLKLPAGSVIAELVFPSDEGIFKREFDVVLAPFGIGWLAGAVTNEREKTDSAGNKITLCTVYIGTAPVAVTGLVPFFKKSDLIYTGQKISSLALLNTTFGLKDKIGDKVDLTKIPRH